MRLALSSLALALCAASPALAETRAEIRGGVDWPDGQKADGTIGGALGYDAPVGGGAFVGIEETVDKALTSTEHVRFGTSARLGTHVTARDKLYATAGYNYGKGPNAPDVGGGWEHSFGSVYGKVEYKHFFDEQGAPHRNAALVGLGVHF